MASRRSRGDGSDAGDPTDDEPRPDPSPSVDPLGSDAAEADDLDEEVEGADADATDGAGPDSRPRRRSVLDARTLVVCTLIALVAALAAGLLVSRLTDDGDTEAVPDGTLTAAEQAPDVPLTRFDGSETSLADYRGQPLVVNFWSTTCQPCVQEMPDLEAVHASLGEDVAFLGVNTQDTPEAAQALAERTGVTYDLAQDVDGELSRSLGVATLPVTVLVLPDGTVIDTIHRQVSSERLCEKINQSLLGGSLEECG